MLVLHLRQYANCQRAIDKTNISSSWEPYLSSNATVSVCTRCDAFCTKATQRDHVLLFPSALPVTNQMMRIVGWHTAARHGCVLTQRVYFSLTQRRRLAAS